MQAVFEVVEQSFRDTESMEETLRVFLRANFEVACHEEGLLAGFIVQAAACAHIESGNMDTPEQTRAAQEVILKRKELYIEMNSGFVAGLSIALRRLRRRPKARYSLSEIVMAVGATSDGFLLLHKLQPDLFDSPLVVETQWNIIWSMSEPGLLDPPVSPIHQNGTWSRRHSGSSPTAASRHWRSWSTNSGCQKMKPSP